MSATIMFRHGAYEVAGVVVVAVAAAARAVGAGISDERDVALDPTQQRDQGGRLLVSQITPENGVKALRDRPKPVEVPSASAVLRQGDLPLGRR